MKKISRTSLKQRKKITERWKRALLSGVDETLNFKEFKLFSWDLWSFEFSRSHFFNSWDGSRGGSDGSV